MSDKNLNSDAEWYLRHHDGVTHGPFQLSAIIEAAESGHIIETTEVRHPQHLGGQWIPAFRVAQLARAADQQLLPPPPPTPQPPTPRIHVDKRRPSKKKRASRSVASPWVIFFSGVGICLAAFGMWTLLREASKPTWQRNVEKALDNIAAAPSEDEKVVVTLRLGESYDGGTFVLTLTDVTDVGYGLKVGFTVHNPHDRKILNVSNYVSRHGISPHWVDLHDDVGNEVRDTRIGYPDRAFNRIMPGATEDFEKYFEKPLPKTRYLIVACNLFAFVDAPPGIVNFTVPLNAIKSRGNTVDPAITRLLNTK